MLRTTTIAQQLAGLLAAWGVRVIFGTAGDSILPFLSILGPHSIRFVPLRNEETAAYAASAYAKLTGTVGVVLADGGPGTGRIVNGLADAKSDRVPLLAITGQVETMYLGTNYKQYVNQQQLLGAVTIRSENLGHPRSLATVAAGLLRTAISQGGPVHLSIPKDFWQLKVPTAAVKPEPFLHQQAQTPDEVVQQTAAWLKQLKRPLILAGRGAAQAVPEVLALAEVLGAGVVRTLSLAGALPSHPLVLGGIGEGGSEAAVEMIGQCGGIVKIGATYWPPALTTDRKQVLSIDVHPANIGRGIPADVAIVGDAKAVLPKLVTALRGHGRDETWVNQVKRAAAAWQQRLQCELEEGLAGHPGRVVRLLSEHVGPDAIICLDVGEHVLWFNRFFQGKGQRVLVSGRWRGMGFSMGAGIAAKLAQPQAQVLVLVGDGGFSMLMGDVASAVELELPVVYVLMNNRAYALEQHAAQAGGLRPVGVQLSDIRYDQAAAAMGGAGFRINVNELPAVLSELKDSRRPTVIDVQVEAVPIPTAHL